MNVAQGRRLASPDFVIVGSPRSGTTLVQRLASELPDVQVPPETHFFSKFLPGLLKRRAFPLFGDALREEAERFTELGTSRGLGMDPGTLVERLGGRCEAPVELYAAIVRELTDDARLCGEKTPEHLLWWRSLSRALPWVKFIAVVRDPRAVVASSLQLPYSQGSHVLIAERWVADQKEVRRMMSKLPVERRLVVRYEDVVADPAGTRSTLAAFLGLSLSGGSADVQQLYLPWERWKSRASGPITSDRVRAWQAELSLEQVRDVEAICRRMMPSFDYGDADGRRARIQPVWLPLRTQWRRCRFRIGRRWKLRRHSTATLVYGRRWTRFARGIGASA